MSRKTKRLAIEQLEDRNLLSTYYGLTWPDPGHLTVSFVPDGTIVDGYKSSLFQTLNSTGPSRTWETAILQAIQTWAAQGNINVGLVADGGQPLGTAGLMQGDPRFGDIRIAAEPMGLNGPVAITAPYDPMAGTRSGDIVFNSSLAFSIGGTPTSYDVFTTALHEAGHVFNLPDETTDPTSVMFANYQGPQTGLSHGDIAALQSLYGTPMPDNYQGTTGNGTLSTASVMSQPDIAGNITAANQSEFFSYQIPAYANSTVNVTVHTVGISLLTPSLNIYNANQQLIASSSDSDPLSGDLTIVLSNVKRGSVFYFQVSGARSDALGMGSYRLQVNSGAVSQMQIAAIEATLNSSTVLYVNFNHSIASMSTANALDQPVYQINPQFDYAIHARLNDTNDMNYYSVTTPANGTQALIFTASPGIHSTISPQVTVYDANGNPVNAEILSNDATSGYVVQVVNPLANAKYYFAVSANPFAATGTMVGTYLLGVNFSSTPIVLQTIVDDTLSQTDQVDVTYLQSSGVQLFQFVLAVNTGTVDPSVSVEMQLFDANGNLVMSLTCQNGNTVSSDLLLGNGTYAARFIAIGAKGAVIPTTSYSLLGISLTNPLDPIQINPTNPMPTTTATGTTSTTTTTTPTDPTTITVITPVVPPVLPPIVPPILPPILPPI